MERNLLKSAFFHHFLAFGVRDTVPLRHKAVFKTEEHFLVVK